MRDVSMTPERIAELLEPFLEDTSLSPSQLGQIETFSALLLKWNAHMNLTAVWNPDEVITRHFGESLFAARRLFQFPARQQTAIDVGSGAGFPGIPLKIWEPTLHLTLIEANQRKAVFLREVVRALGLSKVTVFANRAEMLSDQVDLVILRAVEHFEKMLPIALKLAAQNGHIALLIGNAQIQTAKSVIGHVKWQDPLPLPLSKSRSLLIGGAVLDHP